MLEDREYMRRRPGRDDDGNARSGRTCLLALIVINVAVWLLFGQNASLCLDPAAVRNGDVLRIVTAVFMHEGFFHLLFNMYALYFFGMIIAPTLGARRLLSLFLFSGVAGNVLWLAANWNTPALLLGASGAVMGVIMTSLRRRATSSANCLTLNSIPVTDVSKSNITFTPHRRPRALYGNHG